LTEVRLVRLRLGDLDVMARVRTDEAAAMGYPDAFGPAERIELGERIERSGEFDGTELLLGIQVDGRLAGEVQARQPRMGLPPGVFEIGIDLFDAADRGHGVGSAALMQLVTRLFGEEGAHRVQLTTDVENEAMRKVSTRLGFRFEGVMRNFMPSADGPRDYAIYAISLEGWEAARAGSSTGDSGEVLLQGTQVTLRAFRDTEFDRLWSAESDADPTVAAVGDLDAERLRARVAASGRMTDHELLLAIEADERLVGSIQAYRDGLPASVFGFGIELFDAVDRGRNLGTEAVRLLVSYLFDTAGARRVEAGTTLENAPMRAILQTLGFRQDGVLRRWLPSEDGVGADCVVYGMTMDDYKDVRNRWI
jgi:RimJ/RimL family protein N-acetyltransferase